MGRAGAATWQGMCWTCALLTFALLTFALRMCRRFSTRGLIIWCVLCRHAQRLAKNDVDTRRRHLLLARMPPLCPRACTRGAFDAVPLLTLRLEDPNFFLTRNPILARMPPSPHACTKGALDSVSHPTLLLGRHTRNLLLARMCPSQSSRLETAQGLDRLAHCSKGLAL